MRVLFVSTRDGLYTEWRDVMSVTHEAGVCGSVYTDTGAERFTPEVTLLLRLPRPRAASSAISELVVRSPCKPGGVRSRPQVRRCVMDTRSVPGLVLDEAADVLGELADWLRAAPYCPFCLFLPGCSHEAGCPLGRVHRLRCLLGTGDPKHRDDELMALRRERGAAVMSAEAGPLPAPLGSAVAPADVASDALVPLVPGIEPGAPTVDKAGAT
jgi:hypothetical protein